MSAKLTQEEFFAKVPHWVVTHPDIGPSALKVYAVLSMRAHNTTRLAFPGLRRIAADGHLSLSTVARAVEQLEAVGAVVVTRQHRRLANLYHLPMLPFGGVPNLNTPQSEGVVKMNTPRTDSDYNGVPKLRTQLDGSELDELTRGNSSNSEAERKPGESAKAYRKRLLDGIGKKI